MDSDPADLVAPSLSGVEVMEIDAEGSEKKRDDDDADEDEDDYVAPDPVVVKEAMLQAKQKGTGYSALHLAALGDHLDCVKVLVHLGAKLDAKSTAGSDSMTAAHLAAQQGHLDVLKVSTPIITLTNPTNPCNPYYDSLI